MLLKKSIIIAAGLLIWIASTAQSDSSVLVKPATLDYLFRQNVLSQKYYSEKLNLLIEKKAFQSIIENKDSIISKKNNLIRLSEQEYELQEAEMKSLNDRLLHAGKTIRRKTFFIWSIGMAGIISTTYFIFH